MPSDHGKRLAAALLGGAAVAVTLVAALTAWAAQLGGGAWLPVLAPVRAGAGRPPGRTGVAAPRRHPHRPARPDDQRGPTRARLAVASQARLAHHPEGRMTPTEPPGCTSGSPQG